MMMIITVITIIFHERTKLCKAVFIGALDEAV